MESTASSHTTGQDLGPMLHCACGTENPAGRKFCTDCGVSLVEACFRCGEMTITGQRFCGGCGAELAAAMQQQIEHLETDLLKADQLQAAGRLDEALGVLVPISKLTHSRLLRHSARAAEKIRHVSLLRDRALKEAGPALDEGRRRIADCDYAGAIKAIQGIPESLRTAEAAAVLEQALASSREVAVLSGMLREAVADKQYAGLLKIVSRLLELQPRHAEALSVGTQLQRKYCRSAEEKLSQFQYDPALKAIEQLPRLLWTADTVELHRRVADMAWLARTLRTAAVIDPILVAAARRAAELMPNDPAVAKLTQELQRRLKGSEKNDGIVPRPWAVAQTRSPLGLPVKWLAGFQRIALAEKCDRQAFIDSPACFCVACGLALQGLGLSAIPMDLRPDARQSVVDFVSSVVRRRVIRAAWGLDIGSSSLKAVKLSPGDKDGRPRLEIALRIEHQKPLGQANNQQEAQILLAESLTALLEKCELKGDFVAVGLPGRLAFIRMFKLPWSDTKKLDSMVKFEVQRHIPVNIDSLEWDYAVLGRDEETADSQKKNTPRANNGTAVLDKKRVNGSKLRLESRKPLDILVTAVASSHVKPRMEVLESVGLKPDSLQSEDTALYNLLAYEMGAVGGSPSAQGVSHESEAAEEVPPPARADSGGGHGSGGLPAAPIAVLDLGHEGSRLLLCSSNELWVRNLGFGGQILTRALVKELGVTFTDAERYKRDPLAAPSVAHVYRAAGPVMEDLLQELQLALSSAAKSDGRLPVQELHVLGGGVQFHGLLQFLQSGR
jgi:Tfp pilus assembly PilM family ATPase